MDVKFKVVDLETSIKNRGEYAIGKNKASPFYRANDIVYYGDYDGNDIYIDRLVDIKGLLINRAPHPKDTQLLIGQNIKFDLLYLMRDSEEWYEWIKKGKIWDTQLAEHILTAQQTK